MKTILALVGLLGLLSSAVLAAPAPRTIPAKKTAAAATYQCSKCHMSYTAAQAKKSHYKDPMDGGTLLPVVPKKAPVKG